MSEIAPNQDRDEPRVKPRPGLASASGSGANQAGTIAAGVLLSRIAGLVRDSIFAHFLGDSATADAFKAGFRIPNILQNLFGEGVLSASFIPVYGKLLGEGDDETADMLAWGVGAILTLGVSVLVAIGVLVTPYLIDVIAPGFEGDKRELDDSDRAHPVSRRGIAGDVGVVPRRAQQSSQIFRLVHRAGGVERRDDRGAALLRPAPLAGRARDRDLVGLGRRLGSANRGAGAANARAA